MVSNGLALAERVAAQNRATDSRERSVVAIGAALVVVVLLVATFGVLRFLTSAGLVLGPDVHRIGDDVPTSFGVIRVQSVRPAAGLTHRPLHGDSHGVNGLVDDLADDDHAQLQVAVALTNRTGTPYQSMAGRFTLLVLHGTESSAQTPAGGDLPDTRILPGSGIEGNLDFTVPAGTVQLSLQYTDPGSPMAVLIDLGTSDSATAGAGFG